MFDFNPSQPYLPAMNKDALQSTPLSLEEASLLSVAEIMTKSCIQYKLS